MKNKAQIVGKSASLLEVLRTAELVSATDVPVILTGETGTGKKLFAQHIHSNSQRKQQEFISVNCAALPEDLAESMLFGHKIASSSGATENHIGFIAKARKGTLFLDDVGALSLPAQAKLLRFLERGELQPVGHTAIRNYDVRILAASHTNLGDAVKAGNFRADLFYHLNVIPVELPALREREGDTRLLMEYFFRELVQKQHQPAPGFTAAALKQIARYDWPGNVRELRNFCERLFILFCGKEIDMANLPQELRSYTSPASAFPFSLPSKGIKLEQVEVDLIHQALQSTSGNKSRAARLLGLTRDTFLYRLKKYSIDF